MLAEVCGGWRDLSCTEIGKVCACSLMSAAAGKKATELPLCVAGKARSLLGGGEMNLFILSGPFQLAVTLMPGLVRSFLASTDIKRQLQGFAYLWYRPLIPLMDKTLKSEKGTSNFTSRCFYKRPIFFKIAKQLLVCNTSKNHATLSF